MELATYFFELLIVFVAVFILAFLLGSIKLIVLPWIKLQYIGFKYKNQVVVNFFPPWSNFIEQMQKDLEIHGDTEHFWRNVKQKNPGVKCVVCNFGCNILYAFISADTNKIIYQSNNNYRRLLSSSGIYHLMRNGL